MLHGKVGIGTRKIQGSELRIQYEVYTTQIVAATTSDQGATALYSSSGTTQLHSINSKKSIQLGLY